MPNDANASAADAATDPYLWLEDVTADRSLDWVRKQNAQSTRKLAESTEFKRLRDDIKAILDSDDKIAMVNKIGDRYYNFWQDAEHPRGIWRRTTLEEYRKDSPKWETVLDVDALNKAEGENWVWHGADCLKPANERCLIALSRGGSDADVTREFDLRKKAWIKDGFFRPEAKGELSWIDQDHVYVATDFGKDTMTESGYARQVRRWTRGTPMNDAKLIFEVAAEDLGVGASHDFTPGFSRDFVVRIPAFFRSELFLLDDNGKRHKVEVPESAQPSVHREWLLVELREAWKTGGKTWPAGSLIVARFNDFMAGKREFRALFTPTDTTALAGFEWTRNHLVLNVLDDVKNRLYVLNPGEGEWKREAMPGAPEIGTVSISAVDDETSDEVFMIVSGYLTPATLYYGNLTGEKNALKHMPAFFDASGLEVSQHFATSKDGTRVPYFMVAKKDLKLDGSNPTLQYGYGGFEISLTPGYSATVGRGWLSQGGVYVVANIRGGGEYGPRWHQAALKEKRLRAYEDFAAVSEDLIKRKVTSPAHLGIQGGSNGGLLMGNMTAMYPELYGAVVCQVPLLDMRRYNKLLAGASWMAEYGNPDTDDWKFIQSFSPYQNVKKDVDYPPVLFTTSTRDDRVHPGHARKMMAKMSEQGHDVLYYENIEGGHGGAADNGQRAMMTALAFEFLKQKLTTKTHSND
ncbi:prolyl oligopeptidase family serine peptidase [Dokdonella sp.]|uniref:prolyl oligopeptidase family serine peptidase n=1 Tax=Dokdonella sp. TaxID=2291710 RepID=UPI0039C8870E